MIDLTQFCAREDAPHIQLTRPFTLGDFSYASDGCVCVRTPRRDGVPPPLMPIAADLVFEARDETQAFIPLPLAGWPGGDIVEYCGPRGGDLSGQIIPGIRTAWRKHSVAVGETHFDSAYLTLLARRLVEPAIEAEPIAGRAALIRFEGGVAALMPLRNPCQSSFRLGADGALERLS